MTDLSVCEKRIAFYSERIDDALSTIVASVTLVEPLNRAVEYAVFPAGKRIRPVFAAIFCEDLQGDGLALVEAAACLELLHCASLVHDDLPAFDDDDMRRGKPSCHKAFGESTAILVGDVLVPLAFRALANGESEGLQREKFVAALSQSYIDLCNGQQLDMLPEWGGASLDSVHRLKTGGLFKAAAVFGAIGARVADEHIELAAQIGEDIGALFQLVDDVLDRFGTAEEKGRKPGSDQRNRKETLAAVNTLHEAVALIDRQRGSVDFALRKLGFAHRNGGVSWEGISCLLDKVVSRADSLS